MYVIKRLDGKYLSKMGNKYSYTDFLENARIFLTKEKAEENCCVETERVIPVDWILKP
mgnify:CR=1 FL=1